MDIERSVVIRCLIRESEEEINHDIAKAKTKNESSEIFKNRLSAIVGTPEEVTSKLNEYIDLGITHFILHFVGLNEKSLKLFYSKIIKKI